MNKVISLAVLMMLLSGGLFAQEKVITVMTYNIYHGEMAYERGESNLKAVARLIKKHRPDFVALQEVDSLTGRSAVLNDGVAQNLIQELAAMTDMDGYFGKAIDYDGGGYGEGLLSRHGGTPITYTLPNPEGGESRALLTLQSEVPGIGPLTFAGTHLCHQFEANKIAQAKAIVDIFSGSDVPVLMGGDFNFRPESAPYDIISGSFGDAALIMGTPRETISYEQPRSRIDYIFLSPESNWEVLEVAVLRKDFSDHMPVLVKLRLKE